MAEHIEGFSVGVVVTGAGSCGEERANSLVSMSKCNPIKKKVIRFVEQRDRKKR